jgi:hypothetical protein
MPLVAGHCFGLCAWYQVDVVLSHALANRVQA